MYKFVKILDKVGKIGINIILFIPNCLCIPFHLINDRYKKWRGKKGYSKKTILRAIKFCDEYHKEHSKGKLFVYGYYSEDYLNYIALDDYLMIRPFWMQKRVKKIYGSDKRFQYLFELEVENYYKDRVLTEEQLKQEFTYEDGMTSYWYNELKGKKVIKF